MSSDSEMEINFSLAPGSGVSGLDSSKRELFTSHETALLFTLVEARKKIIEDKGTGYGPKNRKDKAWEAIMAEFNADPEVKAKTQAQLQNKWNNSKKRARKAVAAHVKKIRKTGGGVQPGALNNDTLQIMRIIPAQLKPMENQYDSDGINPVVTVNTTDNSEQVYSLQEIIESGGGTEIGLRDTIGTVARIPSPDDERPKKKAKEKRDPRSSLVDMEYEEHNIRLKTLQVEYETALISKEIALDRKSHLKKLHELESKKLELEISKLL